MVLFVTMVVLAVTIATTVTSGTRQRHRRATAALAIAGGSLWTAAATGLALLSDVPPLLLALVGVSLAYAVHHLTRRAVTSHDDRLPNALLLFSRRRGRPTLPAPRPIEAPSTDITLTLNTIRVLDAERSRREPLHWSVVAAAGTAATALEGYWAYQHLIAGGGVFSDLSALAGFAVLATLTVASTGVAGLAVHMRTVPRADPTPQPMPAPSDMETIAFTPIQPGGTGRFGRRRSRAAASR